MVNLSFLDESFRVDTDLEDEASNPTPIELGLVPHLTLPNVPRPANFIHDAFASVPEKHRLHFKHGTTTLAFVFQGGILACVDSRASMGQYVGSNSVKKIIEINPFLLGTMAGGAADCSFWERDLGRQCRIYELRNKERISVAAASKMLANTVYYYKGMGLSMGTMIMGWDKSGPNLFYVDNDGTRLRGTKFSVGSGSTFALGVLDQGYSFDMSVEDAIDLGTKSIYHATHRDAMSGGIINCYHVKKEGWTKISSQDMMVLHEKFAKYRKDQDDAYDAKQKAQATAVEAAA